MRTKKQLFLSLAVFLSSTLGILFLQNQHYSYLARSKTKADYVKEEKSSQLVLNLQKKLPAFGYDNLVAGWNFLNFVQYFGDEKARNHTGYSLITDYFELNVKHNPRFLYANFVFSTANSLYAGKPDKTVILMNEILKSLYPEFSPYAALIWNYKGIDELLFLADIPAAKHSYQMAVEWASQRDDKTSKSIAQRNRETVTFLATNPKSKRPQIYAWMSILSNSFDDRGKQHALNQIKSLGANVYFTETGQLKIDIPPNI
ncbi:MAG: hypothetical protein ACRC2R_19545 [Xenococcaceae cyanobacterium]